MELLGNGSDSNVFMHEKPSEGRATDPPTVIYVLGGPGSGKGTQCSKIAAHFGFCHLSVGELLEKEVQTGSKNSAMIKAFKSEGKLLPSELVIKLLQQAMEESQNKKFLIDGFPRNEENRTAAEKLMKIEPTFVLFVNCSDETMKNRMLNRNQGRADDNIATIPKRIDNFHEFTVPVVDHYSSLGKVEMIDGELLVEEVFESVKSIFSKFKFEGK